MSALPFKLNQDRRRHIPEQKRKVTNWRDYDESLRRRGSLTVWFSDEAVAAWEAERRTRRGGQPAYSDLAILTALTFKAVFRLAYRQTRLEQLKRLPTDLIIVFVEFFGTRAAFGLEM